MFGKLTSLLFAASCAGAVCAPALRAQVPYLHNHRPRLPAGQGHAVACLTVDLNGDGLVDLVRASRTDFGVFLQDRGGRFEAARVAKVDITDSEIVALRAGGITGSKFPDVVVGYRDGRVMVYPNLGGVFAKPWPLPKISGSIKPAVADVHVGNLDRRGSDEIVITLNVERPVIFRVTSPGVFAQSRLTTGPLLQAPHSVLVDLDRDGDLDLLSVSGGAAAYPGLYGNVAGALKINTTAFPATTRFAAQAIAAAEVRGRPGPELLLVPTSSGAGVAIRIFRNASTTAGTMKYALFGATTAFPVTRPRDLVVADANGDGLPDLIVLRWNGALAVSLNIPTSPGTFQRGRQLLPAAPRAKVCAADLEGDKDLDLIVVGAGVEDSLLLGNGRSTGLLDRDTESRDMPSGSLSRAMIGIVDVTGEGDPDLVSWDALGRAAMMVNVDGQARFERATNNKVPTLPTGSYVDVQSAAVDAPHAADDFFVLGLVSTNNTSGMRVVTRNPNGQLVDVTGVRWRNTTRFVSMTAADITGHAIGSAGSAGFSDVVGLDAGGVPRLVMNQKGVLGKVLTIASTKLALGSEILVADLNLDKIPDLVFVQPGAPIRVFLADPKVADRFFERSGVAVAGRTALLEDVTGDLVPDLVVSVNAASGKVVLLQGRGDGSFLDRTSIFMPKLPVGMEIVTCIATIGSANTKLRSIVFGSQRGADRILRPAANRVYGAPEALPLRGSAQTRRLLARDLDLDGDDDLIVERFATYPGLLLGQSWQFTHRGGLSQLGREARMHVAIPDTQTFGVVAIGYPVVRFALPGMGVVRMGRFSVMLPLPNPPNKLVHEIRLPVPANLGSLTPIPMQYFTIQNGRIGFRNLDMFVPTAH